MCGNIFIALYKEILFVLKIGNNDFFSEGLILLIGFPNNEYHPNSKNYLRCLLFGERGGWY